MFKSVLALMRWRFDFGAGLSLTDGLRSAAQPTVCLWEIQERSDRMGFS